MNKICSFCFATLSLITFGCKPSAIGGITEQNISIAEIKSGTLEEVGLDPAIIHEILDSIKSDYFPNRHSLLFFKDNKLVLEEYFSGRDENWGADSVLHDMRNVS